jgi:hypothetical protein
MESNGENSKGSGGGDAKPEKASPKWQRVEHIFAIIGALASLVAIVGVAIALIGRTSFFRERHEEAMVSNLIAGDNYSRMVQLIGSQPDFQEQLESGRRLYLFSRPWEYIQLLVSPTDSVLSVGIYAKTSSFKATLENGIVINGPPIAAQVGGEPISAMDNCGASWYDYFETYQEPEAGADRSVIFGALPETDSNDPNAGVPCGPMFSNKPCISAYYKTRTQLSGPLVKCLSSFSEWRAMQDDAPPAIVIVTAPGQPVLPDMLNYDYFFSIGK